MEAIQNWWKSVTGTTQTVEEPIVDNPSGTLDGVQGGRKRRAKTRRGTKKSRKTRPRRK
jgi:hypothetical protein